MSNGYLDWVRVIPWNWATQGTQVDLCHISARLRFDVFDGDTSAHADHDEVELNASKLDDLQHREAWSVWKITGIKRLRTKSDIGYMVLLPVKVATSTMIPESVYIRADSMRIRLN